MELSLWVGNLGYMGKAYTKDKEKKKIDFIEENRIVIAQSWINLALQETQSGLQPSRNSLVLPISCNVNFTIHGQKHFFYACSTLVIWNIGGCWRHWNWFYSMLTVNTSPLISIYGEIQSR